MESETTAFGFQHKTKFFLLACVDALMRRFFSYVVGRG